MDSSWVAGVDPHYNRIYYFDKRTRRSTWTHPSNLQDSNARGDASAGTTRAQYFKRQQERSPVHLRPAAATPPQQQMQQRQPAPQTVTAANEWVEVFSETHRRSYWYNKITHESVWEEPEGARSARVSEAEREDIRAAWLEIEAAKRQLQAEREEHEERMRNQWKELQDQISELRAGRTSASPGTLPDAAKPTRLSARGAAASAASPSKANGSVNGLGQRTRGSLERRNSLSQELENFAHSLRRRSSVVAAQGATSLSGGRRRASIVAAQRSAQMAAEAQGLSRRPGGMGGFNEEDEVGEEISLFGGMHKLPQYNAEYVDGELKDVEAGINMVKDEIEAQKKAKEEAALADEHGGYYEALGVLRNATSVQLKKAHRKMMIKWHPDKNRANEEAREKSNVVQVAYETLIDEWEREIYDWFGLEQYLLHVKVLQCFKNYLWTGVELKKHPRKGKPRKRMMWLDPDATRLQTGRERIMEVTTPSEEESIKGLAIEEITKVTRGIATDVLRRTGSKRREDCYFSVIGKERTLDFEAATPEMREFLATRLTLLIIDLKKDGDWMARHYRPQPPPPDE